MPSTHLVGAIGVATLFYVYIVRSLRWKRYNRIHEKYNAKYKSRTLTPEEAQEVIHEGLFYDMPHLIKLSLGFAQFKTYAIPSMSEILVKTGEIGSRSCVGRRFADTEILTGIILLCPISGYPKRPEGAIIEPASLDPRAMIALARINWLHSHYKIPNDDHIHTLCLHILNPIRWAARYGWRPLSPLECYAYYVFWYEIARRMNIKDVPETLEELEAWSLAYEDTNMTPAEDNKHLADSAMDELLFGCPETFGMKRFVRNMIMCLLEDPFRAAMLQPAPPWYYHILVRSLFLLVAFIQGWLCLPRTRPKYSPPDPPLMTPAEGVAPRMHPSSSKSRPWYKAESTGFVGHLLDKLKLYLGLWEELPGPRLNSAGYRLEEVGPVRFEKQGHEQVMQQAAEMLGCPVTGPWSLEKRGQLDDS